LLSDESRADYQHGRTDAKTDSALRIKFRISRILIFRDFGIDRLSNFLLLSERMKKHILPLLLTTAPLFAGEPAPVMAPAPKCDCPQGWTIGLEAMALKAYPGSTPGGDTDTDYEFAGRASVGYEFSDCLFVKAIGFWASSDLYDYTDNNGYKYSGDVDMSYYDLVVGQHFTPGDKTLLSPYVGLRYAMVDHNAKQSYQGEGSRHWTYENNLDSLGIVIGVDGTRSLGNNFSLYGTAKQSVLFGTTDYKQKSSDGDSYSSSSDDVVFVSELGLGVQYDFSFSNIAANIRLGAEGQYWTGGSGYGEYYGSSDIGLAGFVLGANFRF
jgi:hypothetical protein